MPHRQRRGRSEPLVERIGHRGEQHLVVDAIFLISGLRPLLHAFRVTAAGLLLPVGISIGSWISPEKGEAAWRCRSRALGAGAICQHTDERHKQGQEGDGEAGDNAERSPQRIKILGALKRIKLRGAAEAGACKRAGTSARTVRIFEGLRFAGSALGKRRMGDGGGFLQRRNRADAFCCGGVYTARGRGMKRKGDSVGEGLVHGSVHSSGKRAPQITKGEILQSLHRLEKTATVAADLIPSGWPGLRPPAGPECRGAGASCGCRWALR
jgi:hypothetical protein